MKKGLFIVFLCVSSLAFTDPDFDLSMIPAEARPPLEEILPDSAYIIPAIVITEPVTETIEPVITVPVIDHLESGRYYIQIAAYITLDYAAAEIAGIDYSFPIVILNSGSEETPLYRILIGPLDQEESGELLHSIRNTRTSAFIRQGV